MGEPEKRDLRLIKLHIVQKAEDGPRSVYRYKLSKVMATGAR